ncbi:HNH endonuclease [Aeromonas media]|uniref:HNH endonuclease n=1 Tax=Aeromonas media TaxID=651 RepID=UPI0038D18CF0
MQNTKNPWANVFIFKDGKLFNDPSRKVQGVKHGKPVGRVNGNGYLIAGYQRKDYYVHRIIWEIHNGPIPDGYMIDHIDGDRSNNHIENLRLATRKQNGMNCKRHNDRKHDLPKGVYLHKCGKYQCNLTIDGKSTYIGFFSDLALAEQTIQAARETHHGEFARH